MPFKRSLSSQTSDHESLSPSDRLIEEEKPLLVYILPGKIPPEAMSELIMLVESYNIERASMGHQGRSVIGEPNQIQLTGDVEKTNIIVTAIHMRQRLERHVDWRIAVCNPPPTACKFDSDSYKIPENEGYRNNIMASRFREIRSAPSMP